MNKTLLVTMDYLPNTGGVAIYWSELAKYLPEDKFIILANRSEKVAVPLSNIVRVRFFNKWIWPHWLALLFKLPKIVKSHSIKTVIAAQILPIGTICYLLKKVGLIDKYQVSCHGMDLAILKGRKKKLAARVLAQADKVIVNSDYTKGLVSDLGIINNINKISPCPHHLPSVKISVLDKYHFKTNKIILSVGRLVKRKGIAEVIRSLPQVWQTIPDAVYIIVGSGPDKQRLEAVINETIDKKNRNKIVFTGRLSDHELASCYQSAKVFVLTTKNDKGDVEGFGMVYLEAGLFKLPVIASPVGGVTESVKNGKTGIFVDSQDNEAIARTIIKLINNDELRLNLGRNNYNWARQFNWKDEAEKLRINL